jgi:carboxylesterase type B
MTGTKADDLMVTVSTELALRGYIAVSIDYRLGVNITDLAGLNKYFNQAVYRATQDSKAALRFLRANAASIASIQRTFSAADTQLVLSQAYIMHT